MCVRVENQRDRSTWKSKFSLKNVNISSLMLTSIIIFYFLRILKLDPNARFFQTDIPAYRQNRKQSAAVGTTDTLGAEILKEWARISGLRRKKN